MDRDLLIKFLNKKCTASEEAQVIEWLSLPGSQEHLDQIMQEAWDTTEPSGEEEVLGKILRNVHDQAIDFKKPGKGRALSFPWGIAASIFLIAALLFLVVETYRDSEEATEQPQLAVIHRETKPGQKLTLKLPDQSVVILNSNSSLEFDSNYGKEDRRIKVNGEAYFVVSSDPERPFIVDSGDLLTRALGTEFNINTRNDLEQIALTEGKVLVTLEHAQSSEGELVLVPGESATFSRKDPSIQAGKFDTQNLTAWKEGKIRFQREKLKDIFDQLQSWYGVDFQLKPGVQVQRKVSGVFNNESLENILVGLSFSMGFEFSIQDEQVIIKP
ncbi:FecR family protein [Algoriphagus vanfongensis]|uniref:FecR family protein n=1 Tax=Algoriphagus vanfongensis TaxID=426371 RepID=UPI000423ACF6|nr:FecR domain-containing protein [Algoriphagus vanfongensis]